MHALYLVRGSEREDVAANMLTGRGPGPSAVHMAPLEQLSGRGRVTRPHNNDYTQNRVHWGKTITAHRCAQALYIST